MKEKRIVLKNESGKKEEYTLLMMYKSKRMNKEYILYTDETYDSDDKLNIFASIFNHKNNSIKDIENEDEWNEIEGILDNYINGIEHEQSESN